MNWLDIVVTFLAILGGGYFQKWRYGKSILDIARGMLADAGNPTTDIRQAVVQALLAHQYDLMEGTAQKLDALKEQGKLDVRAAEARAAENRAHVETTIVPPGGSIADFESKTEPRP